MAWDAALELGFAVDRGATHLARRAQRGPLYVQRPFHPEGPGVCHVVLLHPPGGLVGGDALAIDVKVAAGAAALVTTPAAGKAYRTAALPVRQRCTLSVADGASLEWFPQETIVYDGAVATLETIVDLAPGARFIGAEALCLGLPARREAFARGSCRQVIEIRRDGRPLFVERGRFDGRGRALDARWGLGGATVAALVAAAPAPAPPIVDEIRDHVGALDGGDAAAVTVLGGGETFVCRYLGGSAERARRLVHDVWRRLRPALLGRDAVAPRIWAT